MATKRTTRQLHALDVRKLKHYLVSPGAGCHWDGQVSGGRLADVRLHVRSDFVTLLHQALQSDGTWTDEKYAVGLTWTPCRFGGRRPWWLCPCCGRRVAVLYGHSVYACRHCQRLTYKSTRDTESTKAFTRADKARARLRWYPGIANPPGDRPKGMHLRTYQRLQLTYYPLANQAFGVMDPAIDKMTRELKALLRTAKN